MNYMRVDVLRWRHGMVVKPAEQRCRQVQMRMIVVIIFLMKQ